MKGSAIVALVLAALVAMPVVQSADAVAVAFTNGTVVRLERMPASTAWVSSGDSDAVDVGGDVFVVGAPFGAAHTLTVGHVSARRHPQANMGGGGFGELCLRGGYLPVEMGSEQVILGGDVVLAVQGTAIGTPHSYERIRRSLMQAQRDSRPVRISVLRDGAAIGLSGS